MANYDLTHLPTLKHLQDLAKRQNAKADTLAGRVAALERVGAEPNRIVSIKVNGTYLNLDEERSVDIPVPRKTSELTNDSGYQNSSQVNTAISTAIAKSGHASFQRVSAVPAVGSAQENVLYLVMNSTTKHYDIYAKVKGDDGTFTMELLDDTTVDLSGYVQKVSGKGLSTNDYTTDEKTKLAGIATGANKYTHPSYTARTSGLYKITVDATGHVSAVTAVTKADITGLGIPSTNTTYGVATASANGLMSSTDKSKLDGMVLATDAEVTSMLDEVFA